MVSSALTLSSLLLSCASFAIAQSTITLPPVLPTDAPSYVKNSEFRSDILNSTNFFRKQHGAAPLKWNESLADAAKEHSDGCEWEHSGGPTGENLAQGYANVTAAVDAWGNERDKYDFDEGEFDEETGHFTQLVWNSTTTVGCGRTWCDDDFTAWYLVCEYYPQGNVIGAFKQNVAKQKTKDGENDTGDDADGVEGTVDSGGDDDKDCPQGADCSAGSITRPNLALLIAVLAIMVA